MLSEAGLVENMAQTAAAGAGYYASAGSKKEVSVGYIAGLKDVQVFSLPCVGDTIVTTTSTLHTIGPACILKAEVQSLNGAVIASCELKIFRAKDG